MSFLGLRRHVVLQFGLPCGLAYSGSFTAIAETAFCFIFCCSSGTSGMEWGRDTQDFGIPGPWAYGTQTP
jgi:hypothetical protein